MTDGQGRTVDFRNTVLIMTSNVGSDHIQETFEEHPDLDEDTPEYRQLEEKVTEELRRRFRPEFLNRVDDTIIFHSLSRDDIVRIVDIQLERLLERVEEKNLDLTLSEDAKRRLAEEGYDPVYGARPLERVIQKRVVDPLAMDVLEGNLQEGDRVLVDVAADGESLRFETLDSAAEPAAAVG